MNDLTRKLQASSGREFIDREIDALAQLVGQYGVPEIEIGEPRFPGDTRRPVLLTWMIDGERRSLLLPPTAPAAKPRNMAREYLEQHARKHGGVLVTQTQRIGLDGRRTIERRVDHFPPPKPVRIANPARRSMPRARGGGRPRAQATRSSARSGDSGSEDGESSEPPPARRVCGCGCGESIDHLAPQARYLNETHRARAAKRRERHRPEEGIGLLGNYRVRSKVEHEALLRRVLEGCRCNGSHIGDEHCIKCGHDRVGVAA